MEVRQTRIALNEASNDLLDDLQPGILKHHGRTYAHHLFLQFTDAAAAKHWIANDLPERIVTAKKQLLDVQAYRINSAFNGQPVVVFALSAHGYTALGEAANMPAGQGTAFAEGMQNRSGILNDPDKSTWDEGLQQDIHCLIIIADSNEETVEEISTEIQAETAYLATLLHLQKGKVLRNEHGIGIEHFGYADGVSQPMYLKQEIDKQDTQIWSDETDPFEQLLVPDPGGQTTNSSYGSFLVFRKLEQNVFAFKSSEARLSRTFNNYKGIKDSNGNPNDELAGAMLVGRFEDGTATLMDSDEIGIADEAQLNNDFNYRHPNHQPDDNRFKCPYHAHIRLTNSRDDSARQMRITRRGIPYNDVDRDEENLEGNFPTKGVGLLFMCYQKHIEKQFEAMQMKANKNFDPVIGQILPTDTILNPNLLPEQWGKPGGEQLITGFPGHVKLKGGEYFFTPSISFLKSL